MPALNGVTLDIPRGMFGLLGPNGAGKSSLMRTLATLQEADSGSAVLTIPGEAPIDVLRDKDAVRRRLGYLPQDFGVYPKVSALDLLEHFAVLKGLTQRAQRREVVDGLLQQVNLWDARKRKLGTYSGGMRQRFGIAQALLGDPRLVIVDEPTAGLDPEERNRFLNLLAAIGENVAVILSTHIVEDVTDLCPTNSNLLPSFGYDAGNELQDRNERRKRGLGEPTRMPKLEDEAARANTYISDDADWLDFRTTVCTAPDQVALAPGYLQHEATVNGRRCFNYAMDRPMLNFYAYLSARWQVKKGMYKNIPIEVYFDPAHPYNVDRMIEAVQKSLAYYEANFTPYQHRQVRIIEFPGYQSFAQSFANTIPYSESIGFIADLRDPDKVDYVFYVTAHEIAHQWWAHQVIGANVQGATVLSESLSQYSALMVMEKEYGRAHMRQFLKTELDRYLAGRGGERIGELPLERVENQQYIHYNKGSLVFYRLREEMGEQAVNRALKRFLQDKGYQQPPYTTSRELVDYLRAEAPADRQQVLTDLFEKITLHDNRLVEARAKKRADGRYDVTLKLHAGKVHADDQGKETPATLDDWIEIGVFANGPSGKERDQKVLYLQRHHVTTAEPTITVTVDSKPDEAGFDPYNKLIDRVSDDNRRKVTM